MVKYSFAKIILPTHISYSVSPGATFTPMYKAWAATQGDYADLDAVLKEASTYNVSYALINLTCSFYSILP